MKLHIILNWKPSSPTAFSSNSLVCTFHCVTQCWCCIAAPFGKENIPACFLWDSCDQVRSKPGFDSSWVMGESSTPGPRDPPVTQSRIILGIQGLVMQTGKQNPTHDMFLQVTVTQIHLCILPSFSSVVILSDSEVLMILESCVSCAIFLRKIFHTHLIGRLWEDILSLLCKLRSPVHLTLDVFSRVVFCITAWCIIL